MVAKAKEIKVDKVKLGQQLNALLPIALAQLLQDKQIITREELQQELQKVLLGMHATKVKDSGSKKEDEKNKKKKVSHITRRSVKEMLQQGGKL